MNSKFTTPMCALAVFVSALAAESAISQDTKVVAERQPLAASETWSNDDKNKDGYLDREELMAYPTVVRKFKDIDTDADNKLSQVEYDAWRGREPAANPAPVATTAMTGSNTSETWSDDDKNKDGYLERDELMAYPTVIRKFKDIDTDRDNKLSQSEYEGWRKSDKSSM